MPAQIAAGISEENVSFKKETYTFSYPGTPKEFVSIFKNFYGPTINAFEAAERDGKSEQLLKKLEEIFQSQNKSGSTKTTSIHATFLRVTVNL